jgi:hypothetical protein
MKTLAARLDAAVKAAGVPIVSLSVGSEQDRLTWRVEPRALQPQAQPILDAFVIPTPEQLADEEADLEANRKIVRAIAREVYDIVPANPNKPAAFSDFMQRIKARYRALTS